jgi:hypothetical protein
LEFWDSKFYVSGELEGGFEMGLRGPKAKSELDWYKPVAELMVNELMSFSAACQAHGVKFTSAKDEHVHEYNPAFRNLLTGLHLDFFVEIGENPQIGKEYVKGVAVYAIRKLAEKDQLDKVTAPLKELAGVLGLTGEDEEKPVFGGLTQTEIDALRVKVEAERVRQEQAKQAQPVQVVVVSDGDKPN